MCSNCVSFSCCSMRCRPGQAVSAIACRTAFSACGDADQLTYMVGASGICDAAERSNQPNCCARNGVDVWLAKKHTNSLAELAALPRARESTFVLPLLTVTVLSPALQSARALVEDGTFGGKRP